MTAKTSNPGVQEPPPEPPPRNCPACWLPVTVCGCHEEPDPDA
jgi:hypothetical protein